MISTSTSPALGPSRSSSTISSGCLGAKATAARVFMGVLSGWALIDGLADGHHAGGLVAVAQRQQPDEHRADDRADRHDRRDHQQLLVAERREQEPGDDRRARRAGAADAEHEA